MNLILHQVVTDIRALRGPLALWLGVLAAYTAVLALKLDRYVDSPDHYARVCVALGVTAIFLLVYGWVLAAMVIQADPLDNPSAFWLTRPVSWYGLLTGKLLVVLPLFLVLPVGAAAAVAAANGARGDVLARFTVDHLAMTSAFLVPVLVAASAAHNLPRMVLVASGFLGIYATVHFGMMSLPWLWIERTGAARFSGVIFAFVWLVVGGLVLLAHQYKTRATHRTCWLAGGLVLLAVAAGDAWPWGFVRDPARPPLDTTLLSPAAVRLSVDPDSLRRSQEATGAVRRTSSSGRLYTERSAPRIAVRGVVRAEGLPPGWVVRIERGAAELQLGGRPTGPQTVLGLPMADTLAAAGISEPTAADVRAEFERLLGARVLNATPLDDGIRVQLFALPAAVYRDQQTAPAALRATVSVMAKRVVLSEAVPLELGRSCRVAGEEVTIVDVSPPGPRRTWTLRHALTLVNRTPQAAIQLVLRNRRTKEALFPAVDRDSWFSVGGLPADFELTHVRVELPPQGSAVVDPRWLEDAELLLAAIEPMGTFEKPLVLDSFTLPFASYTR